MNDESLNRVNRRFPCVICEKPDWCSRSATGDLAICMRVERGSTKRSRNGGFVHVLHGRRFVTPRPVVQTLSPAVADADTRNAAYESLLTHLTLSAQHDEDLRRRRRFSEEAIVRNLYATIPPAGRLQAIVDVVSSVVALGGVPGFWRESRGWRLAAAEGALAIPIRDEKDRIVACQLRTEGSPRYRWLSSVGRHRGSSSGTPPHFRNPWDCTRTGAVILTEGALKADLISDRWSVATVGFAGVATAAPLTHRVLVALPTVHTAVIAFDADFKTKFSVRHALDRLVEAVVATRVRPKVLCWNASAGKGLDDVLAGLCESSE
jgi:hypothetical protein